MYNNLEDNQFQKFFQMKNVYSNLKKQTKMRQKQKNKVNIKKPVSFECHLQKQKYDFLQALQMQEHIIYAFAKNKQFNSQIILYSFTKQDGSQEKTVLSSFNHMISAMKFQLFYSNKHSLNQGQDAKSYYKLIVGFQNGFIQIVDLFGNTKVSALRLDVKKVVSIRSANYNLCSKTNACFVLLDDSSIYAIDLNKVQIFHMMKPNIIMGDYALSMQINQENSFLMQATKGGYIIFWKLSKIYKQLYQRSIADPQDKKLRQWSVFPFLTDHNINIQGLLKCSFYGNCILTLDKQGIIKIILINMKTNDQFIILSEHKIQNHDELSFLTCFEQSNVIFIANLQEKKAYIEKLMINEYFEVYQSKRIFITNMDNIVEFHLIEGCSIIMCRGNKCIGVGLLQQFFQESSKSKMVDENVQYN